MITGVGGFGVTTSTGEGRAEIARRLARLIRKKNDKPREHLKGTSETRVRHIRVNDSNLARTKSLIRTPPRPRCRRRQVNVIATILHANEIRRGEVPDVALSFVRRHHPGDRWQGWPKGNAVERVLHFKARVERYELHLL